MFFHHGSAPHSRFAIHQVLAQVQQILEIFERQSKYHFFASSLLVYYDGDALWEPVPEHSNQSTSQVDLRANVRMIDFTHVRDDVGGRDEGYIQGLRVVTRILQTILSEF